MNLVIMINVDVDIMMVLTCRSVVGHEPGDLVEEGDPEAKRIHQHDV